MHTQFWFALMSVTSTELQVQYLALLRCFVSRGIQVVKTSQAITVALWCLYRHGRDAGVKSEAETLLSQLSQDVGTFLATLRSGKCTLTHTGEKGVVQLLYHCASCRLVDGLVACSACVLHCHQGHDISDPILNEGFCDCSIACKGKCVSFEK